MVNEGDHGDAGRSPDRAPWPPDDIRRIIDAIGEGLLIVDSTGHILYANPAGEELLASGPGDLVGTSVSSLVDQKYPEWMKYFDELVAGDPFGFAGKRLDVTLQRNDGHDVRIELVLSVGRSRSAQDVVICLLRPRDSEQLERFSALTQQLLEVLTASSNATPADQLLDALGCRLGWDVTALWGLEPDGSVICRGVWTTPEVPASAFVDEQWQHPTHDTGGLARLVM
jgi:PAS domain S-box-containing protein